MPNHIRENLSTWEYLIQTPAHLVVISLSLFLVKIIVFCKSLLSGLEMLGNQSVEYCKRFNEIAKEAGSSSALESALNLFTDAMIRGLEASVKAFCRICIAILKAIIAFFIELYLGTFTCLCVSLIGGVLDLATDIAETITSSVEKAVNGVLETLNMAILGVQKSVKSILLAYEAMKSVFSSSDNLNITASVEAMNTTIASLSSITIPTLFIDSIRNLSNKIPDFEYVMSNLTDLVVAPLDIVSDKIDNFEFNMDYIPMNGTEFNLPVNCTNMELFYLKALSTGNKCSIAAIASLAFAIVTSMVTICYMSIRNSKLENLGITALSRESNVDEIAHIVGDMNHPTLSRITGSRTPEWRRMAKFIALSNSLSCLGAGLLMCTCAGIELVIIKAIKSAITIESTVEATVNGDDTRIAAYLEEVQNAVDILIDRANDLFTAPLRDFSSSILVEIGSFQTTLNNTLLSVFSGTHFFDPVKTVIYCTIGRKVNKVEQGLRWVEENVVIEFPFQVAAYSNEISPPTGMFHALTDIESGAQGSILKLLASARANVFIELIAGLVLLGCWLAFTQVGIIAYFFRSYLRIRRNVCSLGSLSKDEEMFHASTFGSSFEVNLKN